MLREQNLTTLRTDVFAVRILPKRQLNRLCFGGRDFFVVSGGAYGLESLVGALNAGWAVLLLVVTPILRALPIALMVAELSSALPQEGGYYVWVRDRAGRFLGIPGRLVDALLHGGGHGHLSSALCVLPWLFFPSVSLSSVAGWSAVAALIVIGMSTVLWNYCGWDNVSTFAEEVREAPRAYPPALAAAMLLIIAAYVPVLAGVTHSTSPRLWNEAAGWPSIARALGGAGFGITVAAMALVSTWSLYNSQLLYATRLPYAMARDGWLPTPLARLSPRTGTPLIALAAVCLASSFFAAFPFTELVVIDILMYSAALLLEFVALIALRARRPELKRPFKVPGGRLRLAAVTLCPMALAAVVLVSCFEGGRTDSRQVGLAAFLLLPVQWFILCAGAFARARRSKTYEY